MEWKDLLKERLDPEDRIQKTYYAHYARKSGILSMSNKKLMFVEEKGFIKKTYNLVLEIPYEKIGKVTTKKTDNLTITDTEGKSHSFTTETNASYPAQALKELRPVYRATP